MALLFHVSLLISGIEKFEEGNNGEENCSHVDIICLQERRWISLPEEVSDLGDGFRVFVETFKGWTSDSRIRDEDVDKTLFSGDFIDDFLEVFFFGYISLNGDDFSVFLRGCQNPW